MKHLFALLVLSLAATGASSTETLQYEPAVVRLTGTLCASQGTDPNDQQVHYPALELNTSVRVLGDATDRLNVTEENVSLLQLVLTPKLMDEYARLKGQDAVVTGTLMHAHTGHHYTVVLVLAQKLEPGPASSKVLQPTCEASRSIGERDV